MHSLDYYGKCMLGGLLACGVTRVWVVTLDVSKCRAQAHSKSGRWPSRLVPGLKKIFLEEGLAGARLGWVPTFFGYGAQGFFKFGLNEIFTDVYTGIVGKENLDRTWHKIALRACASGSAEFFADVALCPFEMTKVRMQVTLPGEASRLSGRILPAMLQMSAQSAETGFPFKSLPPLWGRQVPFTILNFVSFYQAQDFVYDTLEKKMGRAKSSYASGQQLGITFACGYWAGIFCAIATQPMDNLVSMKGMPENQAKSWAQMASEMGMARLLTRGLGTRIIMIGTITGLQWWIYGSLKNFAGLGTS